MAGNDLGHRGGELGAAGAGEHHAVEVAVAGGDAQRLVERVGDDDHAQAGREGPDAIERDERAADGIEPGIEDDHVQRRVGDRVRSASGAHARGHDDEAEIVEQPAEGLGQQGALVGNDYAHVMFLLLDRLHRRTHRRQRTGKCMGNFLPPG